MIRKLNDMKANRLELKKTNEIIENLNDRMKHISIVQNELAEMLKPIRDSIQYFDEKTKAEMLTKVEHL